MTTAVMFIPIQGSLARGGPAALGYIGDTNGPLPDTQDCVTCIYTQCSIQDCVLHIYIQSIYSLYTVMEVVYNLYTKSKTHTVVNQWPTSKIHKTV